MGRLLTCVGFVWFGFLAQLHYVNEAPEKISLFVGCGQPINTVHEKETTVNKRIVKRLHLVMSVPMNIFRRRKEEPRERAI